MCNKFLVSDPIHRFMENQPILKLKRLFPLARVPQYNFNKLKNFSLLLILYPILHNFIRYYLQVRASVALRSSHKGHLQVT